MARGRRTCHVALGNCLDGNERAHPASYVASLPCYPCDEQRMPHAEITDLNLGDARRDEPLGHSGAACN